MLRRTLVFAVGLALSGSACAASAPEVGENADPALVEGRSVWSSSCVSCHGASGGGGRGPQLNDGRVLDRFPTVDEQVELITGGRGGMPSFAGRLTDEEIAAVVRYTREILDAVN